MKGLSKSFSVSKKVCFHEESRHPCEHILTLKYLYRDYFQV